MFIPHVYAFTYELETNVDNTEVNIGDVKEIVVSLGNVQEINDGITSCSMNIQFDSNILLDSRVMVVENWSMNLGKMYVFEASNPVVDNSSMFIIPVKINGNGNIKLVDIVCSDGSDNVKINDKVISFTVLTNNDNTTGNDGSTDSSNCDLSNIILSEGTIQFDSSVTEYNVSVSDIDNFEVIADFNNASKIYNNILN